MRVLSANAFHEKAGRSQVDSLSFFRWTRFVLPPSGHCRHASIRTLEERFSSLGACWAFSLQPVLPSDYRPWVLLFSSGTRARPLTQSPELGFGLCLFSSWNGFDFCFVFRSTRLPPRSSGCCCAMVRTLLRSPTGDAAAPRAFLRWRRSLAFCRSSRRVRQVSVPSVAGHSRCRMVPRCVVLPAPVAFADRDRLLC